MNIKKTVKKMTAILTGATMLGATVMGAMAADLGNYPAPLITNGVWNGKVVVGAAAAATDIAGAAALGASLQTFSRVPVSVGGGVITVEGGWTEDVNLNSAVPGAPVVLENVDLATLQDKTIRHNRTDYDIREQIILNGLKFETNAVAAADDEFETDAFLTTSTSDKIKYRYNFEDPMPIGEITTATPLEISFLGKNLKLTSVSSTSITMEASNSKFMEVGDSVVVDGVKVELIRVGSNSVIVDVNGVREVINSPGSKTFPGSEFEVEVESSFYIEGATDNGATLRLGSELFTTVKPLDSLELYGEPTKEEDAEWVWNWNVVGTDLVSLDAENNIPRTKKDVSYSYERPALALGESMSLPNNFAKIEFAGFKEQVTDDLKVEFRNVRFNVNTGYQDVMYLSTASGNRVLYADDIRTSDVAVTANRNIWYKDSRGDWINSTESLDLAGNNLYLKLDADEVKVLGNSTNQFVTLNFPNAENLTLAVDFTELKFFGAEEGDAEAADLKYNGANIGTQDFGTRLTYGAYFEDPEAQMNDDVFRITVPRKQNEVVLAVSTTGKTTTTQTGGAYQIVPIPGADVGVLDNEVMNMIGTVPMLVVGGPNANTVAANLLGVQQFSDEIADMFQPNRAMIKLFENRNAILVAGYEGKDTRAASLALADFENNKAKFAGNMEVEIIVSGTTVDSIVGVSNN